MHVLQGSALFDIRAPEVVCLQFTGVSVVHGPTVQQGQDCDVHRLAPDDSWCRRRGGRRESDV